MSYFLQQVVNGLSLGSVYALMSVGYSLVYSIMNFSNFAHGGVIMRDLIVIILKLILNISMAITIGMKVHPYTGIPLLSVLSDLFP
jgi:branched-chain amino acid transport system permease protein